MEYHRVIKIVGLFVLAVAIGLVASVEKADACGMGGKPACKGWKDGEHRHEWMKKMNLTDTQKKQIEKVREEQQSKISAKMEQVKAEHEKLHKMMGEETPEADLLAQHAKVVELNTGMMQERFETILKIRGVLTPAQRKQMPDMHGMHGDHGGMMGNHSDCPMGTAPKHE